jgi:hypothetical protein
VELEETLALLVGMTWPAENEKGQLPFMGDIGDVGECGDDENADGDDDNDEDDDGKTEAAAELDDEWNDWW